MVTADFQGSEPEPSSHLPETNSKFAPENGWMIGKRSFLLGPGPFLVAFAVSFQGGYLYRRMSETGLFEQTNANPRIDTEGRGVISLDEFMATIAKFGLPKTQKMVKHDKHVASEEYGQLWQ